MHHVLSRVKSRRLVLAKLAALAVALALVAAACGDDDNPVAQSGGTTTAPRQTTTTAETNGAGATTELRLVGKDIKFDKTELSLPAGTDATITFDNQDDGIPHNLRVDGPEKFATKIENGPITQELQLRIDEPGSFKYFCEVHAEQMKGTLTVE